VALSSFSQVRQSQIQRERVLTSHILTYVFLLLLGNPKNWRRQFIQHILVAHINPLTFSQTFQAIGKNWTELSFCCMTLDSILAYEMKQIDHCDIPFNKRRVRDLAISQ
jgi:hypothetical protein